ncbi:MAG: pentapeptide repeat-containing protein [Acidimicrobiales bacterium]
MRRLVCSAVLRFMGERVIKPKRQGVRSVLAEGGFTMRRNYSVFGALIGALLCALALTAVSSPAGATPRVKKPGRPTLLSAIPVDTAIAVSWSPPTSDGGATVTGYVAVVNPGGVPCTSTGPTSCLATGLKNGKKYLVKVRATNSVGNGPAAKVKDLVPNTTQNCSYVGAYANLQGCNISGETLSGINLTGADLDGTNLYGDSLDGANLTDVNATNADLYHADLTGADLTDANLTDADMNGATFSNYINNVLVAADINGANLNNNNNTATGGDNYLDVIEWGGLTGTPTTLPSGWGITEGYLLGPGIAPSGPYGANLSNGQLVNIDLTDANLTSAYLTDANLTNVNMTDTDLYGASFSGATLTNITWNSTTCPDNTNSATNGSDPESCVGYGI